jgi:hypothetical protein
MLVALTLLILPTDLHPNRNCVPKGRHLHVRHVLVGVGQAHHWAPALSAEITLHRLARRRARVCPVAHVLSGTLDDDERLAGHAGVVREHWIPEGCSLRVKT